MKSDEENEQKFSEFIGGLKKTFEDCLTLLEKKNADYAGHDDPWNNFEMSLLVGVPVERAILVRIMDKISRVNTLLEKEPSVTNEKIEDTLLDAINYLALLKVYIETHGRV
jgi:hypothetical protein